MNAASHAAKYQQQFLRFWLNIRWLEQEQGTAIYLQV